MVTKELTAKYWLRNSFFIGPISWLKWFFFHGFTAAFHVACHPQLIISYYNVNSVYSVAMKLGGAFREVVIVVWNSIVDASSKLESAVDLVRFYGISTLVSYLMPNPLYTYILHKFYLVWFGMVWFYGISTNIGYLMLNPLYTYMIDIYNSHGLGFKAFQPL